MKVELGCAGVLTVLIVGGSVVLLALVMVGTALLSALGFGG